MEEITVNLHNHTTLSDGTGTFYEIAQAGLDNQIDVIIITDHNIYSYGVDGYYYRNGQRLLILVGEEIHAPAKISKDHLLLIGANEELSRISSQKQDIFNYCKEHNAISIIAHPFDKAVPFLGQKSYEWTQWDLTDFSGMELFNTMSEFKGRCTNLFKAAFFALFPDRFPLSPDPDCVTKWDELLCENRHVNGYSGSDAHQMRKKIFGLSLTCFPYSFHFRVSNNHLWITEPLNGDISHDSALVYESLKMGRLFFSLDGIRSPHGFHFIADGENGIAYPGETMMLGNSITLKLSVPGGAFCRIIHNGKVFRQWEKVEHIPVTIFEEGYYRAECYLPYKGELRGWIFSNPIYITRG